MATREFEASVGYTTLLQNKNKLHQRTRHCLDALGIHQFVTGRSYVYAYTPLYHSLLSLVSFPLLELRRYISFI